MTIFTNTDEDSFSLVAGCCDFLADHTIAGCCNKLKYFLTRNHTYIAGHSVV